MNESISITNTRRLGWFNPACCNVLMDDMLSYGVEVRTKFICQDVHCTVGKCTYSRLCEWVTYMSEERSYTRV